VTGTPAARHRSQDATAGVDSETQWHEFGESRTDTSLSPCVMLASALTAEPLVTRGRRSWDRSAVTLERGSVDRLL
jgi:hypothetical protein